MCVQLAELETEHYNAYKRHHHLEEYKLPVAKRQRTSREATAQASAAEAVPATPATEAPTSAADGTSMEAGTPSACTSAASTATTAAPTAASTTAAEQTPGTSATEPQVSDPLIVRTQQPYSHNWTWRTGLRSHIRNWCRYWTKLERWRPLPTLTIVGA